MKETCECQHHGEPCGDPAVVEYEGKALCYDCAETKNEAIEIINKVLRLFGDTPEPLIPLPERLIQVQMNKQEFLLVSAAIALLTTSLDQNMTPSELLPIVNDARQKLVDLGQARYHTLMERMAKLGTDGLGLEIVEQRVSKIDL